MSREVVAPLLQDGQRVRALTRNPSMKLNHLNLTVTNPVETQEFLIRYFGLKPMGKANKNMAFLSDDNGIVLLMSMKLGKESEVKYPATFHIGFIQGSEQEVDENQPKPEGRRFRRAANFETTWIMDVLL